MSTDNERGIVIDIEGSVELTEKDIWPDGDAPTGWDVYDAADVIRRYRGPMDLIRKWALSDCLTVEVTDDDGEHAHPFESERDLP